MDVQMATGMSNPKAVVISMSNEADPLFLYNLHLSEENFGLLKFSEDMNIDFSAFPSMFSTLIKLCIPEKENVQPKYRLNFTCYKEVASPPFLDIIQVNQSIIQLRMSFVAANDSRLKEHIASRFKNLNEKMLILQRKLLTIEEAAKDSGEVIRAFQQGDSSYHSCRIDNALQKEKEKNRVLSRQCEESLKTDETEVLRKKNKKLEEEASCLYTENEELRCKNCNQDSAIIQLMEQQNKDFKKRYEFLIKAYDERIKTNNDEYSAKITRITNQKRQSDKKASQFKKELDDARSKLQMTEKSWENDKLNLNKTIVKLQERVKMAESSPKLLEHTPKVIESLEKDLEMKKNEFKKLEQRIIAPHISGSSSSSVAQEQLAQTYSGASHKSSYLHGSSLPYTTANTASQKPVSPKTPTGVRKHSSTR